MISTDYFKLNKKIKYFDFCHSIKKQIPKSVTYIVKVFPLSYYDTRFANNRQVAIEIIIKSWVYKNIKIKAF